MNKLYWLASYPKSGNTWLRAFIANYLQDKETPVELNKLYMGFVAGGDRDLFDRWTGVESSDLHPEQIANLRPKVYRQMALHLNQPAYFKIHDACIRNSEGELLFPPEITGSGIYLLRNPLDVTVSYAHHSSETPENIAMLLCDPNGVVAEDTHKLPNQLPQKLLSWSAHVCSWVDQTEIPVAIFRYEDLLENPVQLFGEIVQKLDLDFNLERLRRAIAFSSFENLQTQETANGFMERLTDATIPFFRTGRSGNWREELSQKLVEQIITANAATMRRFGYLDANGIPL